jgi:hypothetical protein
VGMPGSLLLVLEHVMIIMIMAMGSAVSVLEGGGGSCGEGSNITWGGGTLHNMYCLLALALIFLLCMRGLC